MVRTFHDAIRRDFFDEEVVGPVDSFRVCPLSFIGSAGTEASPSPKNEGFEVFAGVSVTSFFTGRVVGPTKLALFGGTAPGTFSRLLRHAVPTSALFFASRVLNGSKIKLYLQKKSKKT